MRSERPAVARVVVRALLLGAPLLALAQGDADSRKPLWAYAITPDMRIADERGTQARPGWYRGPGAPDAPVSAGRGGGAPPDPTLFAVPGSKFQFTMAQIRNTSDPVDWFPNEHPPLPEFVKYGRPPNARPCFACHTLNGKGKPENAPIAGLPKDYILRQLHEFQSGVRDTADPRKPKDMRGITRSMTEDDMEQAATFFSSMPWTPWIRVVEADTIPSVQMRGQAFHTLDDGRIEPIGERVVEVAESEEMERLRSPHSGWIAYVPVGSIARGEKLVTTGGGRTVPCTTCHGQDLRGIGTIPGIAGRSPSYLGRQLYDFQTGTRNGELAPLMKAVAANLTNEDLVNILAYVSSRKP